MKIISRIFLAFILIFIFKVVNTQAYTGSGTALDPYQITDPDDVQDMELDLDAYYVLVNDVDMTGYDFEPIGDILFPFTGSLDGADFTISHLTIVDTYTGDDYKAFGLFETTEDATIKDLTLADVDIEVLALDNNNQASAGALVGYAWTTSSGVTTISNVTVSGDISITYQDDDFVNAAGGYYIGGLVGLFDGYESNTSKDTISEIDSSVNVSYIVWKVSSNAAQWVYLGGIVGDAVHVTISDSSYHGASVGYSDDNLTAEQLGYYYDSDNIYLYSGGIVGYYFNNDSSITNESAFETNTVGLEDEETSIKGYSSTGGIVGRFYAYSYNDVSDNTVQYTNLVGKERVGGIIGSAVYVDIFDSTISYVTMSALPKGEIFGGIVGYNDTTEPYIKGAKIDHLVIDDSLFDEISYVGGVAGYLISDAEIERIQVTNSTIHGGDFVGGIVGFVGSGYLYYATVESTTIESNAVTGGLVGVTSSIEIIGSSFEGSINSLEAVGGLIGVFNSNSSLYQCYSLGELTGGAGLGGLIGIANGNIEMTYVFSRMNIHYSEDDAYVGGLVSSDMGDTSSIHEAYFAGTITGLDASSGNIDPLVFWNNAVEEDPEFTPDYTVVYYDSNLYAGASLYALPKTTVLLKTEAGYPDFNFEEVWFLTSTINDGYAFFDGDRNRVTFNDQGVLTMEFAVDGYKVDKPTDPKRTGYVFGGWYEEIGLTNLWNFETYGVYSDITLYAKWTAGVPNTGDVAGLSNALLGLGGLLIMATKRRRI